MLPIDFLNVWKTKREKSLGSKQKNKGGFAPVNWQIIHISSTHLRFQNQRSENEHFSFSVLFGGRFRSDQSGFQVFQGREFLTVEPKREREMNVICMFFFLFQWMSMLRSMPWTGTKIAFMSFHFSSRLRIKRTKKELRPACFSCRKNAFFSFWHARPC